MEDENYIYMLTVQTNAIRSLFESLKDMIADANFEFTKEGVKMVSMECNRKHIDNSMALVYLTLDGDKFDHYHCSKDMCVGINLTSIFKVLKSAKNSDVIIFYISKANDTVLNIMVSNNSKNTKILNSINTLDINSEKVYIPDIEFDNVITIPSGDFQNHIRDLSILSDIIEIETKNNSLILSSVGDFASKKIIIEEAMDGIKLSKISESYNKFNSKYITLFTKGSNLCSTIELYLKSGLPMIIIYSIANLGKIKFCLAPCYTV